LCGYTLMWHLMHSCPMLAQLFPDIHFLLHLGHLYSPKHRFLPWYGVKPSPLGRAWKQNHHHHHHHHQYIIVPVLTWGERTLYAGEWSDLSFGRFNPGSFGTHLTGNWAGRRAGPGNIKIPAHYYDHHYHHHRRRCCS